MGITAASELDQIRQELLADIERWLPEVDPTVRSTLWHGVFAKAAARTDRLYQLCLEVAVDRAGVIGDEAASSVGAGKPLNRLTMGERLGVLRTLDRKRAIVPQTRLISKSDGQVLQALTALRNKFAHGTIPSAEGPTQTQQFLKLARQLCESQLVEILAANNE